MRTFVAVTLLLPWGALFAGNARFGPLLDQRVPPIPACYCLMHEAGKKANGLIFVRACKGEEARMNIDGRDEIVKATKGSRYWERKDGDPEQYEFFESNFTIRTIIAVSLKPTGAFRGGETARPEREALFYSGTLSIHTRNKRELLNIEGECGS